MTAITFVRHGNTYWNREKRAQGHSNNPLNETGIKQANAVAERLAEKEWDMIISSDLLRATETADIISEKAGKQIAFFDQRIREIGRGQISGTIEEERIEKWGKGWRDLDLGEESKEAVRKRGLDFVEDMIKRFPDKNLLVVSHGILIGETLKGLLQDETTGNKMENTSVTTVRYNGDSWEYLIYNNVDHLSELEVSDVK